MDIFANAMITTVVIAIVAILFVLGIGFLIFFRARYKTVPSNEALIVTGPNLGKSGEGSGIYEDANGRSMKIVRGGAYRLKFFQTATRVKLNSFQIPLTTPRVYTSEGVPLIADAVASIKIADDLQGVANFAEQFLGKSNDVIEEELSKVLGTSLRAILAKLSVEKINNDRESFSSEVQKIAQIELNNMGFKITAFGLEDLRDADVQNGYLENLGRPRIAAVRKEAEMAESDADRETRMYKAKNNQEAQDEENRRLTEIAESQKTKDLKEAEIRKETERARAQSEQSYELERTRLSQEVATEQAKRMLIEKEQEVSLELENTKRRQTIVDAEAYEIRTKALADSERLKIQGETEANIILQKGKAEAEAKELMAKALEQYGDAAILEMMIKMLPEYAREIAAPLSNIDSVKIIDMGGSDSGGGVNQITKNVTNSMLGIQESLKESTGMDIKALIESFVSNGSVNNFSSDSNKQIPKKETLSDFTDDVPEVTE